MCSDIIASYDASAGRLAEQYEAVAAAGSLRPAFASRRDADDWERLRLNSPTYLARECVPQREGPLGSGRAVLTLIRCLPEDSCTDDAAPDCGGKMPAPAIRREQSWL